MRVCVCIWCTRLTQFNDDDDDDDNNHKRVYQFMWAHCTSVAIMRTRVFSSARERVGLQPRRIISRSRRPKTTHERTQRGTWIHACVSVGSPNWRACDAWIQSSVSNVGVRWLPHKFPFCLFRFGWTTILIVLYGWRNRVADTKYHRCFVSHHN